MQVFVIASQEEDFLTGIVVAFPLGVEVSKSIEDAYESAVRRWPKQGYFRTLFVGGNAS